MLTAMAGDQPDQTVIKEKKVKYEKTLNKSCTNEKLQMQPHNC